MLSWRVEYISDAFIILQNSLFSHTFQVHRPKIDGMPADTHVKCDELMVDNPPPTPDRFFRTVTVVSEEQLRASLARVKALVAAM